MEDFTAVIETRKYFKWDKEKNNRKREYNNKYLFSNLVLL